MFKVNNSETNSNMSIVIRFTNFSNGLKALNRKIMKSERRNLDLPHGLTRRKDN